MERLTAYDGDYYYPHCMRGSTCDGRGPSEKCKECEFDERICVTLGKYEDTGLTPQEIMELKERDTPKMPQYEGDGYADGEMVYDTWICPNCGNKYEVDYDDYKHCPNCGQAIDEN